MTEQTKKKYQLCLICGGTGKLQKTLNTSPFGWAATDCDRCEGTGKIEIKPKGDAGKSSDLVE